MQIFVKPKIDDELICRIMSTKDVFFKLQNYATAEGCFGTAPGIYEKIKGMFRERLSRDVFLQNEIICDTTSIANSIKIDAYDKCVSIECGDIGELWMESLYDFITPTRVGLFWYGGLAFRTEEDWEDEDEMNEYNLFSSSYCKYFRDNQFLSAESFEELEDEVVKNTVEDINLLFTADPNGNCDETRRELNKIVAKSMSSKEGMEMLYHYLRVANDVPYIGYDLSFNLAYPHFLKWLETIHSEDEVIVYAENMLAVATRQVNEDTMIICSPDRYAKGYAGDLFYTWQVLGEADGGYYRPITSSTLDFQVEVAWYLLDYLIAYLDMKYHFLPDKIVALYNDAL